MGECLQQGHLGYQKMITMTRKDFFWPNMKKEVVEYLGSFVQFQQVKAKHKHHMGLLQPLPIPEWKWEVISMDFIIGLSKSKKQNDFIFVVIENFSKEAHFIQVKSTYTEIPIADILLKEIFILHRIPKEIISDRDIKFTRKFWRSLFSGLEMQLNFSTAYHPQIDGHIERVN